jgi:XTP/dITP diphosphohydrolase
MIRLLLATRNAHKTREFAAILGEGFEITDLCRATDVPEIEETGSSFAENAILKASGASQDRQGLVVADDSGLEVDALDGAPGIYSARYAGETASDQDNVEKLLQQLVRQPEAKRTARFRCVIALAHRGKLLGTFEGIAEGIIVDPPRGRDGFGYDPVFLPAGFDQTFAELPAEIKNQISHRTRAVRELAAFLKTVRPGE